MREVSSAHKACIYLIKYTVKVTLDHKTSTFFENEIYASSESWINNISIDAWFVMIGQYLAEIQLFEYLEFESAKN